MSFHAAAAAIDLVNVSSTEKLLLVILGSYADEANRLWASQATLSEKARLSERCVRTTLNALEDRGFIAREPRYAKGQRSSDVITLNFVPAKSAGTVFEPDQKSMSYRQINVSQPATGASQPARRSGNPIKEPINESLEGSQNEKSSNRPGGQRTPNPRRSRAEISRLAAAQAIADQRAARGGG